jgi:O-antigen/teichoic acid export membrane protein
VFVEPIGMDTGDVHKMSGAALPSPEPFPPTGSLGASREEGSLHRSFAKGVISLGAANAAQRSLNLVGTILAARVGGVSVLGTYWIALSTAGMVSAFMGDAAATLALRYVGQFPRSRPAYERVVRVVLGISLLSAACAALTFLVGAVPLAGIVLHNIDLSPILRIAALSAAASVIFEVLKRTAIALQRFSALFALSIGAGVATVIFVPYGARHGAGGMVLAQGAGLVVGALIMLLTAGRSLAPTACAALSTPDAPSSREMFVFGIAQQFKSLVRDLASWWVIVLVTRSDRSLQNMGFFGARTQLWQIVALVPNLGSQLVLPMLSRLVTSPKDQGRVLTLATYFSVVSSCLVAGLTLSGLPWILKLYGRTFENAAIPVLLFVGVGVLHSSVIPSAEALMMFNVRDAVLTSTAWGALLVLSATWLVPGQAAAGGAVAWFFSQVGSQMLAAAALKRLGRLPLRIAAVWFLGDAVVTGFMVLAGVRFLMPETFGAITVAQVLLLMAGSACVLKIARERKYLHMMIEALIGALPSRNRAGIQRNP